MSSDVMTTPYERVGGGDVVASVVRRFYALMDGDPDYAELRAMHADDLEPMRDSLTGFLTAWLGGPRDWFVRRPNACIMSAHGTLTISPALAGQWVDAMTRAIEADPCIDREIGQRMADALASVARGMARPHTGA